MSELLTHTFVKNKFSIIYYSALSVYSSFSLEPCRVQSKDSFTKLFRLIIFFSTPFSVVIYLWCRRFVTVCVPLVGCNNLHLWNINMALSLIYQLFVAFKKSFLFCSLFLAVFSRRVNPNNLAYHITRNEAFSL